MMAQVRRGAVVGVLLIGLAAIAVATASSRRGEERNDGALGPVRVFEPPVPARGTVVLLSDAGGWTAQTDAAAEAIGEAGQIVVGLDTPRLLAAAKKAPGACLDLAQPIADAAAAAVKPHIQHNGARAARAPVLAGTGAGAALAYAVLAQSVPGQFSGAVPVAFTGTLASAAPLCSGAPGEPVSAGLFHYLPAHELPGWVRFVSGQPENAKLAPYAAAGAEIIPVRGQYDLAASVIAALAQAHHPEDGTAAAGVADLPLVPLPVDHPGPLMAVIYSGDGGWRDADRRIGQALQANGVPVVGVDSLRYFWQEQTPEQVAADLAAILNYYPKTWGTPRVLLIGYSFGADILPFAVNRLAPEDRARIVEISLLGLAARADFAIQVTGWLGGGPSDTALPVLPEIARLDLSRVQCFYGTEEEDSACPTPALTGAEIIAMPGGHHFDGQYEVIARRILDGAKHRAEGSNSAPDNAQKPPPV